MKLTPVLSLISLLAIYSGVALSEDTIKERVSITNVWSGSIITVYKESSNSWLWGYSRYSVRDYGNKNNWYVFYNSDSSLSFKNEWNGNCIESTNGGDIVHNRCNSGSRQRFIPILTSTGALMLKNKDSGTCLDNGNGDGESFNIHLVNCINPGKMVDSKLLWVLAAPFSSAVVSAIK